MIKVLVCQPTEQYKKNIQYMDDVQKKKINGKNSYGGEVANQYLFGGVVANQCMYGGVVANQIINESVISLVVWLPTKY